MNILDVTYEFNKENNRKDRVVTVKLADYVTDLMDTIKQMIEDLKRIQTDDIDDSLLTRIESDNPKVTVRRKNWKVRARDIGSALYWDFTLGPDKNRNWDESLWSPAQGSYVLQRSGGDFT